MLSHEWSPEKIVFLRSCIVTKILSMTSQSISFYFWNVTVLHWIRIHSTYEGDMMDSCNPWYMWTVLTSAKLWALCQCLIISSFSSLLDILLSLCTASFCCLWFTLNTLWHLCIFQSACFPTFHWYFYLALVNSLFEPLLSHLLPSYSPRSLLWQKEVSCLEKLYFCTSFSVLLD